MTRYMATVHKIWGDSANVIACMGFVTRYDRV